MTCRARRASAVRERGARRRRRGEIARSTGDPGAYSLAVTTSARGARNIATSASAKASPLLAGKAHFPRRRPPSSPRWRRSPLDSKISPRYGVSASYGGTSFRSTTPQRRDRRGRACRRPVRTSRRYGGQGVYGRGDNTIAFKSQRSLRRSAPARTTLDARATFRGAAPTSAARSARCRLRSRATTTSSRGASARRRRRRGPASTRQGAGDRLEGTPRGGRGRRRGRCRRRRGFPTRVAAAIVAEAEASPSAYAQKGRAHLDDAARRRVAAAGRIRTGVL